MEGEAGMEVVALEVATDKATTAELMVVRMVGAMAALLAVVASLAAVAATVAAAVEFCIGLSPQGNHRPKRICQEAQCQPTVRGQSKISCHRSGRSRT